MEKPNFYGIMPADVRYDKNLKPMEKILYTEITALTNSKGYCFATNSYFAELYDVHKNTVGCWISNLEKQGYIKTVLIYKNGTKEILERRIYINQKSVDPVNEKIDTPQSKNCDPVNEKIDTPQSKNCDPVNEKIDTPINKKIEDNNTRINITRLILNNKYIYRSKEFIEAFESYKKMRKSIKKPMTENSVKRMLKKLEKIGNEEIAIKMLNQAEDKCWLDVYEVKEGNNGNNFNARYSRKQENKHSKKPDYTKGFDDWN